jgi:predicted Zn finger-like uncharacterized protein
MFSQCPKCETAFRITPEQLQQANGKVRCGKCQHIYNALNPAGEQPTAPTGKARPKWLNDPEEQRALEIEAELDQIERTGQQRVLQTDTPPEDAVDAHNDPNESAEEPEPDETAVADESAVTADSASASEVSAASADLSGSTLTADDIAEILAGSDEDLLTQTSSNDDFFDDDEDIDSGTIVMIDDDDSEDLEVADIDVTDDPIFSDSLKEAGETELTLEGATLVPEEHLTKDAGDALEFSVPKQQWGKFFAGRYEGPIIESVGPLYEDLSDAEVIDYDIDQEEDAIEDDAGLDLTDSIEPGMIGFDADEMRDDDVIYIRDDDGALDDLKGLLEEESEALQTYSDLSRELTDDDIDEAGGNDTDITATNRTVVADEADTITVNSDMPSESANGETANTSALRSAINTLSMEKAEWQRLLEAAENEPETLFVVEDDELANEQAGEVDLETLADSKTEYNESEIVTSATNDNSQDHDDYENIVLSSDDEDEATDAMAQPLNRPTAADLAATPLWLKDAEAEPAASGNKRWLAISGVLLAILLLGSQLIHHNREVLATDPNYGETVRKVYELLNRPLYPAWELSAYKIRSSEAIYGESTKDFLDIRAQLAVTGDRPMGEPEIKVILKDRWGSPLNTWMFTPDKYMQGMRPPNGLIQPGTLIPLTLSVLDPGSAAQGFELAVCVRREGGVLQCSGQQ